jgi:hypothetical protein
MKRSVSKVLLLTGLALALVGTIGIFAGMHLFPDSWWLGRGMLFGPLYLLGLLLVALSALIWILQRLFRDKSNDQRQS